MITIRITGARELTENFRQLPARSQEALTIALRSSLRDVRNRARLNHKFTTRSGETERGIEYDQTGPLSGVITASDFSGAVTGGTVSVKLGRS